MVDLFSIINDRVDLILSEGQKSQQIIKPTVPLKNKKSFKSKKEENEKPEACPHFEPIIISKSSTKEEKLFLERQEKQRKKQELFSNYSQLMSYKIHDIDDEIKPEVEGASATRVEQIKSTFGIYRAFSFPINPLYFTNT